VTVLIDDDLLDLAGRMRREYPDETAGLSPREVAEAWIEYSTGWAASWMATVSGDEVRRVMLAWRGSHPSRGEADVLREEVERLRADRAALLDHWILKADGRWHFCGVGLMPQAFATREEAEAAVLAWARDRKR
jgi:hypothetical protein